MIFELAYHVQSFLNEHNKPPPKSFHEEMLERQAQEAQQRQLEAQRKEEQEVRPSVAMGTCVDSCSIHSLPFCDIGFGGESGESCSVDFY